MFGPNTYTKSLSEINFSHRDKKFIDIFERVTNKFSNKFSLNEYDILFIPGSGTVGMESIFFSSIKNINVIGNEGVFKKKWENFSKLYSRKEILEKVDLYCSLETSNSSIYEKESSIVDAISSFPYYNIPNDTKIFATCSNKQIGSFPGLAIVCVKKNYWKYLKSSNEFSYLNLRRYFEFAGKNQTPSTAPTQLYQHLEKTIDNFDLDLLKNKINKNSQKIVDAIGLDNIIGESCCPVITIEKRKIPHEIAVKFNLYGLQTASKNYQIFTYSCDDEDYDLFCKAISK